MKSGYEIVWTPKADKEFFQVEEYLQDNWPDSTLTRFYRQLEQTLKVVATHPLGFPAIDEHPDIRKVVIAKFNSVYYRIHEDRIEILSFFSNRQDPEKINIE